MQLKCCENPMCCKCACELAKRCTCSDDCEAVIVYCPFCRELSSLDCLDIFLGMNPKIATPCKTCESLEKSDVHIVIGSVTVATQVAEGSVTDESTLAS
jgi:hypothetical protein